MTTSRLPAHDAVSMSGSDPYRFLRQLPDPDLVETQEWIDSVVALAEARGSARTRRVLLHVLGRAAQLGVDLPAIRVTDDINTIPVGEEPAYPGDEALERRIRHYIRCTGAATVWCFAGDGEMDEPEHLACIAMAGRERLDNLILVVNCDLQRLDGPVRGNSKVIQELEGLLRGAGWNVIKVIWGRQWDDLLAADTDGLLVDKMNITVDGEFQKYRVESGACIRKHFFGPTPQLAAMVDHLSDDDLRRLRRGGHDPRKVHAAYRAALDHPGAPTVVLAKTVKGWALGPDFEARNATHQMKKMTLAELETFRDRLELPITDAQLSEELPPYAHPGVASTRPLRNLLRDPKVGDRIVPIVPDEARTFGIDALFRQSKIYAASGQLYEPVDAALLLSYQEATDGQILEEGITEAGSMASMTAAATAYATWSEPMIPFFVFSSMFGFHRLGDLIWALGDMRGRGLLAATAGRTTCKARDSSTAMDTASRGRPSCPMSAHTTPRSRTKSRSSSPMAYDACTAPIPKTSSITSPSTTRPIRCRRCPTAWRRGSSAASTDIAPGRRSGPAGCLHPTGPPHELTSPMRSRPSTAPSSPSPTSPKPSPIRSPAGRRNRSWRSAPMASASPTNALRFAAISRSTRRTSWSPPCTLWRNVAT